MYYHQAMKAPDQKEFIKEMDDKITGQINNGNLSFIPRSSVPLDNHVLPTLWAMRCRRCISAFEIYEWNARLNMNGSKQVQGLDYWQTYAPVANCASIHLLLNMLSSTNGTRVKLIFQAYTQAEVKKYLCMVILKGYKIEGA